MNRFRSATPALAVLATAALGFQGYEVSKLRTLTAEQQQILGHLSLVELPDGLGGTVPAIRVQGINLQLVNGTGATESANGTGNLVLGYNEPRGLRDERTGSHCLVIGSELNYESWGAQVLGKRNSSTEPYASVLGGSLNDAKAPFALIAGGELSSVFGDHGSVFGGHNNFAFGPWSTVAGGHINTANGSESTISGGWLNVCNGDFGAVSGGYRNDAAGQCAAVAGGQQNTALADFSAVGGGSMNQALHLDATVAGGCSLTTSEDCQHLP